MSQDLEQILATVESLLVDTFGFPADEARHRLNLWRAQQHTLEGQALEATLPTLPLEERAQALLRWALEGEFLESDLREGARTLGLSPGFCGDSPGV